jgi:hypothetical protein
VSDRLVFGRMACFHEVVAITRQGPRCEVCGALLERTGRSESERREARNRGTRRARRARDKR